MVPPLLFWTFHSLGRNLTDTVVTRREHTLVTHGPYRWVRHPFYGVVLVWGLSLTLLTANWLIALLGLAVLAMLVRRTRVEEAKLTERFGDEYRSYAAKTGRFFPLPSRRAGKVEKPSGMEPGRELRNIAPRTPRRWQMLANFHNYGIYCCVSVILTSSGVCPCRLE